MSSPNRGRGSQSFFTLVAVGLASIGVCGVISYSLAHRSTETGADGARVLRVVLNQGVTLGAAGVVLGVAAAAWLTLYLKTLLFGIEPLDLHTFTTIVVLLFGLTLLTSWVPAAAGDTCRSGCCASG